MEHWGQAQARGNLNKDVGYREIVVRVALVWQIAPRLAKSHLAGDVDGEVSHQSSEIQDFGAFPGKVSVFDKVYEYFHLRINATLKVQTPAAETAGQHGLLLVVFGDTRFGEHVVSLEIQLHGSIPWAAGVWRPRAVDTPKRLGIVDKELIRPNAHHRAVLFVEVGQDLMPAAFESLVHHPCVRERCQERAGELPQPEPGSNGGEEIPRPEEQGGQGEEIGA